MLNRNERMEKLNNAGVNTGKYFTVNLPDGLAKNSTITLTINENGEYTVVNANEMTMETKNDVILNQIIEDGYVRNTKLHRRFVMAQMFSALNYVSYDGRYKGYNECIKRRYGYDYTFTMMLEEVRVLSKLEVRDRETFLERVHFFDKETVAQVLEDYIEKLKAYVETLPTKKCKGIPYKRIKGTDIFVEDLDKKLYTPIRNCANKIRWTKNYNAVYLILEREFMKKMIKLPYDTPKSKVWFDTFKGEGSFYTMKNLVMYHSCDIHSDNYLIPNGPAAVEFLKDKLDEYKGEGWRMFAMMNKLIKDNRINTKTHIAEVCDKNK